MAPDPTVPPRVPASKLVVPELPVEFTPRPRLRQLLEEASAAQVIVVSAPAGFGKTQLLADWGRGAHGETAWISLDADDNDPRRLWSAVVASLLAVPSVSRNGGLQRLAQAAALPGSADVVEELAAALDAVDPPVRIVLDDVHELTGQQVVRDLARLIRRRPAGGRRGGGGGPRPGWAGGGRGGGGVVRASGWDPPVSVPRLRREGRLHEVRAD